MITMTTTQGRSGYTGDLVKGVRHGQGQYQYPGLLTASYSGQWENGKKHGQGTLQVPGAIYQGEFIEGQMTGYGTKTWYPDDQCTIDEGLETYQGQFYNGERHGYGTMRYKDGSEYKGEWNLGIKHGQGALTYPDGSVFEGTFDQNKRHGPGILAAFDNSWTLEATFRKGDVDPEEKGVIQYQDGAVYEGGLKDFYRHGHGVLTPSDTSSLEYRGEWEDDEPVNAPSGLIIQHSIYKPPKMAEAKSPQGSARSSSKQKGATGKSKKKEPARTKVTSLWELEEFPETKEQFMEAVEWTQIDTNSLPVASPPLKLAPGDYLPTLSVLTIHSSDEKDDDKLDVQNVVEKVASTLVDRELAASKVKKGVAEKKEALLEEYIPRIKSILLCHPSQVKRMGLDNDKTITPEESGRRLRATFVKVDSSTLEENQQHTTDADEAIQFLVNHKRMQQEEVSESSSADKEKEAPTNTAEDEPSEEAKEEEPEQRLFRESVHAIFQLWTDVSQEWQKTSIDESCLENSSSVILRPTTQGKSIIPRGCIQVPDNASGEYEIRVEDITDPIKYGRTLTLGKLRLQVIDTHTAE